MIEKEEKRFVSFGEAASALASRYGRETILEHFIQKNIKVETADISGLAFLKFLLAGLEAIFPVKKGEDKTPEIPANRKTFPGVKFGDILWSADYDGDGDVQISKMLVVCVTDENHVLAAHYFDDQAKYIRSPWNMKLQWVCDESYPTEDEAIQKAIEKDEEYYTAELNHCKAILSSLKKEKQ